MDNIFVKGFRWFFASILILVLFMLLIVSAFATSVSIQITQEENLKKVIKETGIYEQAVPLAVDTVLGQVQGSVEETGQEISREDILGDFITEEEIKKSLSQAFPPEWIQSQAEGLVGQVYAYVRGDQDDIAIELDLSEREDEIKNAFASIYKSRVDALPDCGYYIGVSMENFDFQNAECWPSDISREQAHDLIDAEVQNLPFVGQTQTIYLSQLGDGFDGNPARRIFFFATFAPVLLWAIALVLVSILFALVPDKKPKSVAQASLWGAAGAMLLVSIVAARANSDSVFTKLQDRANIDIDPQFGVFIKQAFLAVYNNLFGWMLIFAASYIFIAGIFVLLARSQKYETYYKYISYAFWVLFVFAAGAVVYVIINAKQAGLFT